MATDRESHGEHMPDATAASDADEWFVRKVLPLEAMLVQYLHHNWRNPSDVRDLLHDVYVRVYEAARTQIPDHAKAFVFTTARNLLITRARQEHIVSIEAVADLEALGVAHDEPGPDRNVIARDELRRLQAALDRLAPRCREAFLLRRVEGLSRAQIALRMGIGEHTVKEYLASAMWMLADTLYSERADFRRPS
ncbi:MAG TPA: RNA polymerase sigma factor [Rhizomicrobium sp.]|nr:RNA polymerase sigma factor [Rhizomicrobium sp.]